MDITKQHGHELPDTSAGHETTDVDLSMVDRIGILSLVVLAASMIAMWWLMSYFRAVEARKDEAPSPVAIAGERIPSGPRLQTTEPQDLQLYRTEKTLRLDHFGWVNKAEGLVHIPIENAKQLVLKRGFPPRDPAVLEAAQAAAGNSPAATPSEAR